MRIVLAVSYLRKILKRGNCLFDSYIPPFQKPRRKTLSEIIRGASQYTKCGGCRGYYGNNINKFGKKIFIVEMCQKVPEEIREKGQFVTNEV
jgi:hypothetical protein